MVPWQSTTILPLDQPLNHWCRKIGNRTQIPLDHRCYKVDKINKLKTETTN